MPEFLLPTSQSNAASFDRAFLRTIKVTYKAAARI